MKTKKILLKITLPLILLLALLILAGCAKNQEGDTKISTTGGTKEFNIVASQFKFTPDTITVKRGDLVKITAESSDIPHGLSIPEYNVDLYLDGLTPKTAEFIADESGTFVFFCSVPCGRGHGSMKGKLIVEE